MRQRIRNRSIATGSVTRLERDALEKLASKWRVNALSTVPVDASSAIALVKARYRVGGLEEPNVVVVSSPFVMSIVAGAITGILYAERTGVRSMHDARRFGIEPGSRVLARSQRQVMTASPVEAKTQHSSPEGASPLGYDVAAAINMARRSIPRFGNESWLPSGATRMNSFWSEGWQPAQAMVKDMRLAEISALNDPNVLKALHDEAADAISMLAENMQLYHANRHVNLQMESHNLAFSQPVEMLKTLFQNLGEVFDISPQLLRAYWMRIPYQVNFGNFVSDEAFFSEAMHEVFGIADSKTEEQKAWEAYCLGAGICLPFEQFCVVSDRPARISIDESGRLHDDGDAAIQWRDGLQMHYWHGTFVPGRMEHFVSDPKSLTTRDIEAERNAEMRRLMLEIYGLKRYVLDTGAHVIDVIPEDHCIVGLRTACLLKKSMGRGDSPLYFVNLLNSTPEPDGTRRRYLLRVDPDAYDGEAARNVHAAVASTWRNADGSLAFDNWLDYIPAIES